MEDKKDMEEKEIELEASSEEPKNDTPIVDIVSPTVDEVDESRVPEDIMDEIKNKLKAAEAFSHEELVAAINFLAHFIPGEAKVAFHKVFPKFKDGA